MANPFRDNVVLITGASSGIGRALSVAFAKQGAHVVLVARNEARLRTLKLPGEHLIAPADVTKPDDVQRAINAALERFGRIDVLVNNAGKGFCGTVEQTSLEEFRDVFDTNFFGAFHFTRAVAPQMIQRRSGLIIRSEEHTSELQSRFGISY